MNRVRPTSGAMLSVRPALPLPPSGRRVGARSVVARSAAALAVAALAACGGGSGATAPAEEAPRVTIAAMVLENPRTGEVIFSHDDHWHGFPVVGTGAEEQLRLHFVARGRAPDDHDPPPRAEWFTLADRGDHQVPGVVEDRSVGTWAGDRVEGRLRGARAGATRLALTVVRGVTTLWQAPSLNFTVRDR